MDEQQTTYDNNTALFVLRVAMFFLKKWSNSGPFLFIFVLFKHKFYRKNCRCQRDLNSDRWSRRQAC